MKHRVVEELHFVLIFVGIVWGVFLLDLVLPGSFNHFGLEPRRADGLIGVITMPFLHGSWNHLIGNTVPLIVLLCLLAGSKADTYAIVPQIIFLGGLLLWVLGRSQTEHIGASGLVYGLIAFLIVAGLREGRIGALAIAFVVGVTYGATLMRGILPMGVGDNVSWDGHLMGAIAGGLIARRTVHPNPQPTIDIA